MKDIYLKFNLNIIYRYVQFSNFEAKDIYVFKYAWREGHLIDDFVWEFNSETYI